MRFLRELKKLFGPSPAVLTPFFVFLGSMLVTPPLRADVTGSSLVMSVSSGGVLPNATFT